MKIEDVRSFWDTRSKDERETISKILKEKYGKEYLIDLNKSYEDLENEVKEILNKYFEEHIKPQADRQQLKYDGLIEEELPASFRCPRCGSPVKQVFTKRGIHYKCTNPACGWDSNRPFDFDRDARLRHVRVVATLLKEIFPQFNFVENFPYSPDLIFTWKPEEGKTNYDIAVYWMGHKIQRIRVEINQNLTKEQFFKSDYCYVIGLPRVVDYLAKRKGIVVHYLVDEPKESNKILMSRMDLVAKYCPKKFDKFGNLQYFIPKEIRRLIVVDDYKEMKNMLTLNLFDMIYGGLMIL